MGALRGKVAWATGAGSGIGRACALELTRRGMHVALSGRRGARLEAVAREIDALGVRALSLECDVRSPRQVEGAVASVVRSLGTLDMALANAGFMVGGRITELSAEDWRRQLDPTSWASR